MLNFGWHVQNLTSLGMLRRHASQDSIMSTADEQDILCALS